MTAPRYLPVGAAEAEAIAREQQSAEAKVAAERERVNFPRSRNDASEMYMREYRHACQPLMRAWASDALADFFLLYPPTRDEVLSLTHDARIVAEEVAAKEILRPLTWAESKLLGAVVRDLVATKALLRDVLAAEGSD